MRTWALICLPVPNLSGDDAHLQQTGGTGEPTESFVQDEPMGQHDERQATERTPSERPAQGIEQEWVRCSGVRWCNAGQPAECLRVKILVGVPGVHRSTPVCPCAPKAGRQQAHDPGGAVACRSCEVGAWRTRTAISAGDSDPAIQPAVKPPCQANRFLHDLCARPGQRVGDATAGGAFDPGLRA